MKKRVLGATILAATLVAGALTACSGSGKETTVDTITASTTAEDTTAVGAKVETTATETEAAETTAAGEAKKIIVGAGPAPHVEVLNAVREVLVSKGYELDIAEYTSYMLLNNVLDSGDLNANCPQHKSYLGSSNEQNGVKPVSAGVIHYKFSGIHAGKTSFLDELKGKATVLAPNDASNEARALLFLEAQGLIKSKEGVGLEATRDDIVENPKNLDIIELEAAQLPCSLPDCDTAAISGNYAAEVGSKVNNVLAVEDLESLVATTYGNIVAVREGDETTDAIKALAEALTNLGVEQFTKEEYEGAVVPPF